MIIKESKVTNLLNWTNGNVLSQIGTTTHASLTHRTDGVIVGIVYYILLANLFERRLISRTWIDCFIFMHCCTCLHIAYKCRLYICILVHLRVVGFRINVWKLSADECLWFNGCVFHSYTISCLPYYGVQENAEK